MDKLPITKEGFVILNKDLEHLKSVERPAVIQAISEAREHGDLSENAEYHAAKEKQNFLEGKIRDLEDRIARSEVIDISKLSGDTVKFGAKVKLLDLDNDSVVTYRIVGEYESKLEDKQISINSPIARAMLGRKKDEFIEVKIAQNNKEYQIQDVCFDA